MDLSTMERRPERRWYFPITVPTSARPDFFMVASFGRCKLRLTPESVGNILNICLGGIPEEFRVTLQRDRTFRFLVTNKLIGFHIANLASFTCSNFVVYFHLWDFGGPDYIKEFHSWEHEEQQSWESPKKFYTIAGEANALANYAVDPAPLLPGRFDIIDVSGRPQQCRYHVIGHLPAKNEDVAIVNLVPPPNPDAPFHVTMDMIVALLDSHLGIRIDHMQRSLLGHAIIRLVSTSDRDWLVLHGPRQHNGVNFIFTEHNRGINWRSFAYNQEVCLMLLNLPLDLWDTAHFNASISKWGKLLSWDKTVSNLTRAIVKVRVEALADIPFSLQFTHGNDFNAESWTVPIYILSQCMMGLEAPEEQDPPDDDHGHHNIPDLNEDVVGWQPWLVQPDDMQQNHRGDMQQNLPEDPPLAQNLMDMFDAVQNNGNMQVDQGQQQDQDGDTAITLTLSSNAPDQASDGSVNQINHNLELPLVPYFVPNADGQLLAAQNDLIMGEHLFLNLHSSLLISLLSWNVISISP
ncbi:hypothetical protein BRADI_1g60941v3 [Brachypodium distachyon]|uniref:DUF7597 domain-containing protein n=1 Tax=Brachypodium distachyon TaxID=15368 RepID=A0A0Q3JVJ7_BRADI|nr:hypothetical protein BRADI_1g60941v3 [Brachypodium distachyon]